MRNTTTNIIFLCRLLRNITRIRIWKIILCPICFLFLQKVKAQTFPDSLFVDVSKVQSAELITKSVFYTTFQKNALPDKEINQLDISQKIPEAFEKRVPLEVTGKDVYIKFFATNSADTSVTFYFSPGMYCKKMELFQKPFADPKRMLIPAGNYASGFTQVTLQSKEKVVFVARLNYIMTTITTLSPAIVKKDFI